MNRPIKRRTLAGPFSLLLAVACGAEDSGPIRFGGLSFARIVRNPKTLEILDFVPGSQRSGEVREKEDPNQYKPYIGRYRGPRRRVFAVLLQNGGLAVEIPGRASYELRDPDEQGVWFFKVSRDVGVSFQKDGSGKATGFVLTNRVRIPKKDDPPAMPKDVPEEFRPYLGKYPIPMDKREIKVLFRRGTLAVDFPGRGIRALEGPDAEGVWIEPSGGDRFSFLLDESGKVKSMILQETLLCTRIE